MDRGSGQCDRELGELAWARHDFNLPAVLLYDDVVRDRKAKARTLPGRLRREEWLEDAGPQRLRDACAVFANLDLDALPHDSGRHRKRWLEPRARAPFL